MASTKRILVVDDEETICRLAKRMLDSAGGYTVEIETDGSKVTTTAREFKPDLLLLDVVIPDVEGYEINDLILTDSHLQSVPVVFMTGILSDEEVLDREGMMLGRPCIAKPITKEKLLNCLAQHLD